MKKSLLPWILAAVLLASGVGSGAPAPLHREVLVFIPAYEGSQLFDPDLADSGTDDPTCVWGNANVFFSSNLYFALRMPNRLLPRTMLTVGPVDIYRGFVKALTNSQDETPKFSPYTEGADFFIFPYDWRQDLATVTAPKFARAMESYARIHAEKTGLPAAETKFIIVTHSMGGLVARTWLSENPGWAPRISQLYQVAAPNRGSVKAVRTVICGPDSLKSEAKGFPGTLLNLLPTDVNQNVTKLVGITRPTLYELLPYDDPHWTQQKGNGSTRKFTAENLLEARTWEPSWPSAELEKKLFVDGWLKQRESEGRKQIAPADWEFCQDPAFGPLKALLRQTIAWRAEQGSLQHTASLLTRSGESTRLRIIFSTGLKTPSGVVSWGEHDSTQASYVYKNGNDGDGTMEAFSVLDGFAPDASNVKAFHDIPHGKMMINRDFLSYFLGELAGQPMIGSIPAYSRAVTAN